MEVKLLAKLANFYELTTSQICQGSEDYSHYGKYCGPHYWHFLTLKSIRDNSVRAQWTFYQSTWHKIRGESCNVVCSFWVENRIPIWKTSNVATGGGFLMGPSFEACTRDVESLKTRAFWASRWHLFVKGHFIIEFLTWKLKRSFTKLTLECLSTFVVLNTHLKVYMLSFTYR